MPSEHEKWDTMHKCLRTYHSPADIIRFLGYPKQTVYNIKKRFDAEMVVNGNVAVFQPEDGPCGHVHEVPDGCDGYGGHLKRGGHDAPPHCRRLHAPASATAPGSSASSRPGAVSLNEIFFFIFLL